VMDVARLVYNIGVFKNFFGHLWKFKV
jgi:hypothetical protein